MTHSARKNLFCNPPKRLRNIFKEVPVITFRHSPNLCNLVCARLTNINRTAGLFHRWRVAGDGLRVKNIYESKNLQEVTGRTSSWAWNLWKPLTYCSIEENSFRQGSYSLKFERWYRFHIADQGTARYSLCSGAPNDRFLGDDLKWLVMHPGVL